MLKDSEFEDSELMIAAIKRKLRYWIVDHTGLRPPKGCIRFWIQALREIAEELESAIQAEEAQTSRPSIADLTNKSGSVRGATQAPTL